VGDLVSRRTGKRSMGRDRRMACAPASHHDSGTQRRPRRSNAAGADRMTSRRSLIKALAGTGVLMMTGTIRGQQSGAGNVIKRAIPSTGEQIPVIGLGTYQAFDIGNDNSAREQLNQVLKEFVAKGGSVVDSSPMYGRAE